ncbi:MAG: hypothetical protein ACRD3Q_03395 [Terriglobales bacterium]
MKLRSAVVMLLAPILAAAAGAQNYAKTSWSAPAAATRNPFDAFRNFSATLNGGIAQDHDRKIYRSGNLMRLDFGGSYRITDLEKSTTWGVDPHSCAQFALPDAGTFPFSAYRDFKVERTMTEEKETVDGHPCAIELVTFTPTDGRPLLVKMKLWEAEDLDRFPIKIEVEPSDADGRPRSKVTVTYTDVNLSPPEASLFKHPARCTVGLKAGESGPKKQNLPGAKPGSP